VLDKIVILLESLGTLTKYASKTLFCILKEDIIKLFQEKGLQLNIFFYKIPFSLNDHKYLLVCNKKTKQNRQHN